ncbi:helix-turn-helix domain-containing protein [candidate division WOR-3 bacterium]|nr:helix-turn-helix domain-containing protein [candidate division WOR-3 bacterium]
MTRHSKTAFTFGPELRARLRQLRERRGLSLRAMAVMMDRQTPGGHAQLSRLERGRMSFPTFNFVMDYLRTCGARSSDVADLLDTYLSQPPVLKQKGDAAVAELLKVLPKAEQRAMLKWEKGMVAAREARGLPLLSRGLALLSAEENSACTHPGQNGGRTRPKKRPETDRQRVFRIVWSFIHANWNEVFEQKLYEAMLKLKDEVPRSRRRDACGFGRRFFGILTRYYRRESRRTSALERVEREAKQEGFSNRVVAMLRDAANLAYRELLLSGSLDWQPTEEEIIKKHGHAPKVEKAETRLEMDEASPVFESNKVLSLIDSLAIAAVGGRLDKMKVAHYHGQEYYFRWINELVAVAHAHGTDSPEWQASIEKWTPKLPVPEFVSEAAQMVAEIYNRWKVRLPPKPVA